MADENTELNTGLGADSGDQLAGISPALANFLHTPEFMRSLATELAGLEQAPPARQQAAFDFGAAAGPLSTATLAGPTVAAPAAAVPLAVASVPSSAAPVATAAAPALSTLGLSADAVLERIAHSVLSLSPGALAPQLQFQGSATPATELIPVSPAKEIPKPPKKKPKVSAAANPTGWTMPVFVEPGDCAWKGHDSTNKRRYVALVGIVKQLRAMQTSYFPPQAPTQVYKDYDRLVRSILYEMRAIRIAETSEGGWATVAAMDAELETDDPALLQAIARAEARVKQQRAAAAEKSGRGTPFRGRARGGGASRPSPTVPQQYAVQHQQPMPYPGMGYSQYPPQQFVQQQPFAHGYPGFGPGIPYSAGYPSGYPRPPLQLPRGCFTCGATDHYQKICPQRFQQSKDK